MNEEPEYIPSYELLLAEELGRVAFGEGINRSQNPYHRKDADLAEVWWKGWDTALEEKNS